MSNRDQSLRRMSVALTVIAVVAVGGVLYALRTVLIPLAVALFLSYIAMPVVRLGRRAHIPVSVSLIVVILAFAAAIGGIGSVLYTSGAEFVESIETDDGGMVRHALTVMGVREEKLDRFFGERVDWEAMLREILSRGVAQQGVSTLVVGISFLTLVLLFMSFIVMDRGHGVLDKRLVSALSEEGTESARPMIEKVHSEIERYITLKTGISILTGALAAGTLWLFDVPYPVLFGILTFLLNYIPNIGSIVATIPPVLVALATFDSPIAALPVLVVLASVQFAVGNILEPIVFGRSLRLNPSTVLLALVFWGFLWGIWGAVLAVPLTATLRIILDHFEAGRHVAALMGD